ncbi:hypothetical protein ISF_04015 [Cordyceps fumosorosea ARSEF 2679]|uniref:Uncharacterized protein n=1 Tax=Cordyceps fumosorosea (strain ARSEF 2679) TaxID=1081104 RepID=A0A167YCS8_CORFA|nr:hypothetical protein ISF_04015 [Cordyceps fumosorosea ARSEF 2679]OAA66177.1 hypothetical protein ISF_04015 [Cordyceps fumosorosea ARSEF 2679]
MASSPELPSWMSWAGLIEHFSPSVKVHTTLSEEMDDAEKQMLAQDRQRALRVLGRIIPDASKLPKEEAIYELNSLTFKSCGYVDLDHPEFRIQLIPGIRVQLLANMIRIQYSHSHATQFMQRRTDLLLGRILRCEVPSDRGPFHVFKFRTGWEDKYHRNVIQAAIADECSSAGMARFSGALVREEALIP